jgi:hypothetical protein
LHFAAVSSNSMGFRPKALTGSSVAVRSSTTLRTAGLRTGIGTGPTTGTTTWASGLLRFQLTRSRRMPTC